MDFRPMRRSRQQVALAECEKVLREEKRGALSVIGDGGYPYTVPVNFYYDETDKRIYIHCSKVGHKAEAISNCDKVCFTVWNQGFKTEGSWEWNSTSVVIFGRVTQVTDRDILLDRLRKLAAKYYPSSEDVEKEMSSPSAEIVAMLSIEIEHITGKLVNEK